MLNPKTNKRELAYIVQVSETKELPNYNNVHYIHVNGWWCVASKDIKENDLAIYFEIDSLLPKEDKRFSFMERKRYRVKTIKICGVLSQGLVLSLAQFPELKNCKLGDFVTDQLKVQLYEVEIKDPVQFTPKVSPLQRALDQHPKLAKFPPVKFLLRFDWFKFLLAKILVPRKFRIEWPNWLPKTGSERIQNIPQLLEDKSSKWILSEKVDGMSTSFILDERDTYLVCSHNVVVYSSKDPSSKDIANGNKYIKSNPWLEMSEKYSMQSILQEIKKEYHLKTVAIQGETYGEGIQKRNYSKKINEHDLAVFHIWFDGKRLPIKQMEDICASHYLKTVTVYSYEYTLPDTVEELVNDVDSRKSSIDDGDIEGFVIYSQDGKQNYKCVSPSYLVKYHR